MRVSMTEYFNSDKRTADSVEKELRAKNDKFCAHQPAAAVTNRGAGGGSSASGFPRITANNSHDSNSVDMINSSSSSSTTSSVPHQRMSSGVVHPGGGGGGRADESSSQALPDSSVSQIVPEESAADFSTQSMTTVNAPPSTVDGSGEQSKQSSHQQQPANHPATAKMMAKNNERSTPLKDNDGDVRSVENGKYFTCKMQSTLLSAS